MSDGLLWLLEIKPELEALVEPVESALAHAVLLSQRQRARAKGSADVDGEGSASGEGGETPSSEVDAQALDAEQDLGEDQGDGEDVAIEDPDSDQSG